MKIISSKKDLAIALNDNENKIVVSNFKIVNSLKLLNNINITHAQRNRCKYTLENNIDDSAFLGFIGFAPIISEIGNVSFLNSMGIISSVGLHQILIILSHYTIKYDDKNNNIILTKI